MKGQCVDCDYLSKAVVTARPEESFEICLQGAPTRPGLDGCNWFEPAIRYRIPGNCRTCRNFPPGPCVQWENVMQYEPWPENKLCWVRAKE